MSFVPANLPSETEGTTNGSNDSVGNDDRLNSSKASKLLRKMDQHCLPPIIILWFFSFIDRVNIGMARLEGLEKDLEMKGSDFNIALVIFFAPFILFEVPANMILGKISPRYWLPAQNFLLALFTLGQGLVTTKGKFYAMRFMIGFCEAGLVPGSIVVMTMYYARYDLQWRLNMLLVGNALASAFGGLLAYAISDLSGAGGYLGWRWIFIIEGSITAVVSLICLKYCVGWPEEVTWLSDEDRALLKARIVKQAGTYKADRGEGFKMRTILSCLRNRKMWLSILIYIGTICSTYAINLFAPTIVKTMHPSYSGRHVQALCIPIFIASACATMLIAYASDRLRHRYTFAMIGYAATLIGLVMFLCQEHLSTGILYAALFLISIGTYISLPIIWTMCVDNVSGYARISTTIALCVGIGNAGGIVSSCVFTPKEAPTYWTGFRVTFACTIVAAVATTLLTWDSWRESKPRDLRRTDFEYGAHSRDLGNLGKDDTVSQNAY